MDLPNVHSLLDFYCFMGVRPVVLSHLQFLRYFVINFEIILGCYK